MKKFHLLPLLTIIIIIILFVSVISGDIRKNASRKTLNPTPPQQLSQPTKSDSFPYVNVTGVIRTSGLSADEKQIFGLNKSNFIITGFREEETSKSKVYGYFLENDDSFAEKYEGKCVRLKGTLLKDWEGVPEAKFQKNGQFTYSMLAAKPTILSPLKMSECSPYKFAEGSENFFDIASFSGTLKRGIRPAPDIGYDYILTLNTPYLDQSSSTGSPAYLKQIDVMPFDNDVWIKMEDKIGQKVFLNGYYIWGYAESKYLETRSVE